jgi:hypothetical protein
MGSSEGRGGSATAGPGAGRGSAPLRALLLVLSLALAGALALSAPALAAAEPTTTHAFSGEKSFAASGHCELLEPGGVAIDEATHDIFVYDRGGNRLDWFHADGTCVLHRKTGHGESGEEEHEGVAVDNSGGPASGDVYVVNIEEGGVIKYQQQGTELERVGFIKKFKNSENEPVELEEIHGISVDSSGNLWVYNGEVIDEFDSEAKFVGVVEIFGGSCGTRPGFAVSGSADAFYVGRERENHAEECEEPTVMMKLGATGIPSVGEEVAAFESQLDLQATSGVAVDRNTGEVYFDNKTSISAYAPSEDFIERFGQGSSEGNLRESTGVAVSSATNEVFAVDAVEGRVDVFVPSTTVPKPGEPKNELPDGRGYEQVSPQNKFASSIYPISVEFGMVQASKEGEAITYTASGPIVAAPPVNRAIEPSQNVSRRGTGGWATEAVGTPHGPAPNGYDTASGTEYEFFSSDLSTGLVTPFHHGSFSTTEALLSPEANEDTPYWRDLSVPSTNCEPLPSSCYQALVSSQNFKGSGAFGNEVTFADATPDAHSAVLLSTVALTAQPIGEGALYEWQTGGELKLVSVLPEGTEAESGPPPSAKLGGAGEGSGGLMRHAISENGSRVFWSTGGGSEASALYVRDTSKGETLRVDKAQGGAAEPETGQALFQSASNDGSKVFFTDTAPLLPDSRSTAGLEEDEQARGFGDLYVCEIEVVESTGKLACNLTDLTAQGEAGPGEAAAVQGVLGTSENGSYVYFVANGVLGGKAGTGKCVPREEVERTEELEKRLPVRRCNVYVEHRGAGGWEAPAFIASVSTEDEPDWYPVVKKGALGRVTSRVSPNGLHLAFMSSSSLTGYDSRATNSAAAEAPAQEVFTYDAEAGLLACPSCNPSGARPNAVLDQLATGEGKGLLVDQSHNWLGRWLAASIPGWTGRSAEAAVYQSRYLTDSGRLFFTSADALVKGDKNGKMDVYELDPNGEGGCASATGCIALLSSGESPQESAFLDASVSGNDVFILTSQQLVKQDIDSGFDVYDVRVCGSSGCFVPPGEPTPPCADEVACKGGSAGVPALPPVPATAAISGPGNSGSVRVLGETSKGKPKPKPLTRAQKLKRALKQCKKIKRHKKRQACIKQANKRYGAKKSKAKKSTHGGSHR